MKTCFKKRQKMMLEDKQKNGVEKYIGLHEGRTNCFKGNAVAH